MNISDQYRNVIVTGPQRSGTRIVSKIIAHETGFAYIDEEDFTTVAVGPWKTLLETTDEIVVHCPAMSAYAHEVPDDTLVVFIYRNVHDILKSQNKLNWDGECTVLISYGLPPREWLDSCRVKYMYWENYQRARLEGHRLEVDYPQDIEMHELYIPPEDRAGFAWNQTTTGEVDERGNG